MTVQGCQTSVLASLATKGHRITSERANPVHARKVPVDPGRYVPQLNPRFEILERIRVDSTGIVFKVYDIVLERIVAVRVLPYFNLSQSVEARFVRDFKAISTLSHPNILEVLDYGKTLDGAPYMVTEYFDGEDLASIIDHLQTLSPVRAEIIFLQLADALAYAHRQGVIHRDIKPSNVLVRVDADGNQTIKLMDFGISKTVAENIADELRARDAGSLCYSSPEQIRGNVFDARSDLYSLGCVIYEILVGRSSIKDEGENPIRLRDKNARPDISERLEYCISRCLEKDATARVKDADGLIYYLTSYIAKSDRPQLRPPFPWRKLLKLAALLASAYVPFYVSQSFSQPLWLCLATYVMALVVLILYAAQNEDLNYRLRSRSAVAPRENHDEDRCSTMA